MRRHTLSLYAITLAGAGIIGFGGCQGNTDGGSAADPDYRDEVFVGDETSTGSIRVVLNESHIRVGDTSGFKAYVTDSKGQPIPNTRVICDTEQGVALIEPTTGYELTNGDGVMSGAVGCVTPGSYQMVCRLSIGANRRQFVSVTCTGDIPNGFTGFPGAGGGGLGGGRQTSENGDISITEAGLDDDGNLGSSGVSADASVDIFQSDDCDTSTPEADFEPFYDTYAVFNVENNLEERVTLMYLDCAVTGVDGTNNTATCGPIRFTRASDASIDGNNGSTYIQVPVFKGFQGGKYIGSPTDGTGTRISQQGIFNVAFKLYYQRASDKGVDSDDLPYISASVTASFSNLNRCP